MEAQYTGVINHQTDVFTKVDKELAHLTLQMEAIGAGAEAAFVCVDKDLEALDQQVDCRWEKCKRSVEELQVANGKIAVLEERSCSQ